MIALIMIGIVFVSFVVGFYIAGFIDILENKMRLRHEKRFDWYYKMGLLESACLIEPKYATKYWMGK